MSDLTFKPAAELAQLIRGRISRRVMPTTPMNSSWQPFRAHFFRKATALGRRRALRA